MKNKGQLTQFAKNCAYGSKALIDGICMSEEVAHTELGMKLRNNFDDNAELILEVAKRFAKVVNDRMVPDTDVGSVQEFCDIIQVLVDCCEENNWFEET